MTREEARQLLERAISEASLDEEERDGLYEALYHLADPESA